MTKYVVTLEAAFDLYYDGEEKIFDELRKLVKKMINQDIEMVYSLKEGNENINSQN